MSEPVSDGLKTPQDARLRALARYGAMDGVSEPGLDSLVRLAARLCDAPIGLVTLVDEARQVFRARVGFDGPSVAALDVGFCPLVMAQARPLVIPDTLADPAHAGNAAARDGGVRFYAGVPLIADGEHVLGTLCVLDTAPRPAGLTPDQLDLLQALSAQVVSQFDLRRSLAQRDTLLAEQQASLRERDALARVQAAIAAAAGDLDTILAALVSNAMAAVAAADGGVLELIDGDELEYRAVAGALVPHQGLRVPLHGSLAGSCAATNTPILIDDARGDDRVVRDLVEPLRLRAAVMAPVAWGGRVLGVLKLQSSRPFAFGPRDLEAVRLFAGVATAGLTEVRAADAQRTSLAGARRLRAIFESAVDFAIVATDLDGRVTDWNAGAERVLGWTANDMRGQTAERIFVPADRQAGRVGMEMHLALRDGRASDERWHLRRDGSQFWASGEMSPLRDGQDAPIGFLKILRDRTAEHAMEAERDRAAAALRNLAQTLEQRVDERTRQLQDAQDFTRLALSSVGGVGAWTYDVASDTFFCSAAIADLYGVDPDQAGRGIGRLAFTANVHPTDKAALAATMAGGLDKSGDLELEYRICHPDGSIRWVLSRGHTYQQDGKPTRRVGIGVETTRQHQLEDQLRQSQKMEAVGQLTGGLAHDFNNLLTGVTGSLELLQTRIAQGRMDAVDRYIAAAQNAAQRAAALTHRLLAFSRRQTLDPKPTDVTRLIDGMEDLIRRTMGPEIIVAPAAETAGLWTTLIDPGQLENALLNLCINARDAMPDGGTLTIKTGNRSFGEQDAKSRDLPPGQYVSLCVSDTGAGMAPDVIAQAFDPFFTTKPIGLGTGLGLSMIYGFAKQSGGQVRISSELGQGTTVCLTLPRHLRDAAGVAIVPELADAPRAEAGQTVLVVDDDATIRMLVTEVLQDLGYRAIEAADGAAAMQVLRSTPRIDLVVTDVGLPGGMNGRQVADAARVARPGLKILFITGYAEKAVLHRGDLDPDMHVLIKPFAMEALASRIKTLIST